MKCSFIFPPGNSEGVGGFNGVALLKKKAELTLLEVGYIGLQVSHIATLYF